MVLQAEKKKYSSKQYIEDFNNSILEGSWEEAYNYMDITEADIKVVVPKGSTITVDGEKLFEDYISEELSASELEDTADIPQDIWVEYTIPCLFATPHSIHIEKDGMEPYDMIWNIDDTDNSMEVLDMKYYEKENWRGIYAQYIIDNFYELGGQDEYSSYFLEKETEFIDINGRKNK